MSRLIPVLILALDLFLTILLGSETFTSTTPRLDARLFSSTFLALIYLFIFVGVAFVSIVIGIWSFVISIKTMAEAHQFSSWRGLATILAPTLVILAIALVCVLPTML